MDEKTNANPGLTVFLSASVPHRDEWKTDAKPTEIEEAIVSVARSIFARGGRLLFGGHPSVSPLIAAVAGEYFSVDPRRQIRPVITFQSEFFKAGLPDETWELYRMGWATILWTPTESRNGVGDRDLSLETMRRLMLMDPALVGVDTDWSRSREQYQLEPPKAMVAIGGMEGIGDETAMFLEYRRERRVGLHHPNPVAPIFVFTSGGGAAARLFSGGPGEAAQRLWPPATDSPIAEIEKRSHRAGVLRRALYQGQLVPVEAEFRRDLSLRGVVVTGEDARFQPYAAMAQWLMERLEGAK